MEKRFCQGGQTERSKARKVDGHVWNLAVQNPLRVDSSVKLRRLAAIHDRLNSRDRPL